MTTPRLSRAALAARTGAIADAAPIRIVHLGIGNFARAHQAWFTAQVDDTHDWGIAAFTGRSPAVADDLTPQDGLFTLVERSAEGDATSIIDSIVEVNDGANVARLVELIAAPATAIVTLTVTEAGYRIGANGRIALDDPIVAADHRALRGDLDASPSSALGRLLAGLAARWRAGAGPLAVVPCDNMPHNGPLVGDAVIDWARQIDVELADWIDREVGFVSTSVDRITPRTTADDIRTVEELTGWRDASPVVTEPFRDWILSGDFPAGRPAWERAGARFVGDIDAFEKRKLWMLNGSHSLLAYAGLMRGHETIAQANADPELAGFRDAVWAEVALQLAGGTDDLDLDGYADALRSRFSNARIAHRLAQISDDAVTKLRVRAVPVLRAARAAGRSGEAHARMIGAWIACALSGIPLTDAHADAVQAALTTDDPVRSLVAVLDAALAEDTAAVALIRAHAGVSTTA